MKILLLILYKVLSHFLELALIFRITVYLSALFKLLLAGIDGVYVSVFQLSEKYANHHLI